MPQSHSSMTLWTYVIDDRISETTCSLSVLIHPLSDNDLKDHTTDAIWLGAKLQLDESMLDPPGFNKALLRIGTNPLT